MATRVRKTANFHRKFDAAQKGVQTALYEEVESRLPRIRRQTPVRTGRLRRGWRVNQTRRGASVFNRTPYTLFVEAREGIIERNLDPVSIAKGAQRRLRGVLRRMGVNRG